MKNQTAKLQKRKLIGLRELVGRKMGRDMTNYCQINEIQHQKIFFLANMRKLKGTSGSITESLIAKRMGWLNKAREEHDFTNVWNTGGMIL